LQTFVVQLLHKLILGMAGVWPPQISIVYGLWMQTVLNQVQSTSETVS